MRRAVLLGLLPVLLPGALAGCQFAADIAAVGVGAGAGAATGNPAVAFAVGIGARTGFRELGNYVDRRRHAGEQDAIASAAGAAPVGDTVPWEIRHTIPFGNHHGELAVAREYATALATCREIVFTVAGENDHDVFTTSLCRAAGSGQDGRWQWAAAEPAVSRWRTIQ